MFEPETVKGFEDHLPPESLKRRAVRTTVEKQFELFGFLPMETPLIEFDEVMRPDNLGDEDEAVSDRFRLQDRGGRNLGLRYEFTFQLARIFKKNPTLKLPFKRYQIGPNLRDEPTGTGRFREFTQCDADVIGDATMHADAECLALAANILKKLKIKGELQVNNRKLLNAIIESTQVSQKEAVMRELDKLDKIGEDMVKSNLRKYADSNQILTLFKLMEKDLDFFVKNLFEGAEELRDLRDLGKYYGYTIQFTPFLVRGFSYYTGNIFEIKAEGTKNAIGGGGRYDKVVGKYLHREVSAVGISFGLERLTEAANITSEGTKTIIISFDQDKEAIKLANSLRNAGISCVFTKEKPGKALEYANAYAVPYALFVGKEELQKKKFKLKNMISGEEKYLSEKQLISTLSK